MKKCLRTVFFIERGSCLDKRLGGELAGARCIVYGAAVTGRSLIKYLDSQGAEIYVSDMKKSQKEVEDIFKQEKLKNAGYFKYGESPRADYVFRTPGMHPLSQEIVKAVEAGAVMTGETELFFARKKGKVIGVTGSDGKTTTVTLTSEILKSGKRKGRVFKGGNIGLSLTSFLSELTDDDLTVAELSSFQLMTLNVSPEISAITNITENHLDYHKDMEEYIRAKFNIFKNPECEKLVISEGVYLHPLFRDGKPACELLVVSDKDTNKNVYIENGNIKFNGEAILSERDIKLRGKHNIQNFMTAIALTHGFAKKDDVIKVAREFCGVKHRMETVLEKDGVLYCNSSIDSTPARSCATLECFDVPTTVICGGYDKNLDYISFAEKVCEKAENVVVCGANTKKILSAFDKIGKGNLNILCEENFSVAVEKAVELGRNSARENGRAAVVLTPASASFDMFENYERRGELFSDIVKKITM